MPDTLPTESAPIDRKLVSGTRFSKARTYDELFELYFAKIDKIDKNTMAINFNPIIEIIQNVTLVLSGISLFATGMWIGAVMLRYTNFLLQALLIKGSFIDALVAVLISTGYGGFHFLISAAIFFSALFGSMLPNFIGSKSKNKLTNALKDILHKSPDIGIVAKGLGKLQYYKLAQILCHIGEKDARLAAALKLAVNNEKHPPLKG